MLTTVVPSQVYINIDDSFDATKFLQVRTNKELRAENTTVVTIKL